jgi:hypothetical protein
VIRAVVLAAALLAGCAFPSPSDEFACVTTADCAADRVCDRGFCVAGDDVGNGPDAGAVPDGGTTELCGTWGAVHFDPCTIVAPLGPLVLAGANTYDTTNGILVTPAGEIATATQLLSTARLISVSAFTLSPGATLRVTGARPLVIASWSTIEVAGAIDASSGYAGDGAGANPKACGALAAQPGVDAGVGAGGGGGGGYGGTGGLGGVGDGGDGGPGGGAAAPSNELRGGCRGANGGTGNSAGGTGGSGGGSIQLSARTSIAIDGIVHAGGAGGAGATGTDGGGGGGGSGGRIGLDATTIAIGATAILAANGGGGGGGSASAAGGRGGDGAASRAAAAGGTSDGDGGGGAGGASLLVDGGTGTSDDDHGAGGGGGAAGLVAVTGAALDAPPSAIVSPLATFIGD